MGKKSLEYALYGITIVYSFVIAGTSMGTTVYVGGYLAQRAGFYIAEVLLLLIGWIRCDRLNSKFDFDYFRRTEKIFEAAETVFVLIGIVTVISVVAMVPIFLFLPKNVFEHGAANGLLASLPVVGLIFALYLIVVNKFNMVVRQKEEAKRPLGETPEEFFAFSTGTEKKRKEASDHTPVEMPDASEMLDDTIPDEEDFQRHLQMISLMSHVSEPAQLWECLYCGSLNSADSEQCDFCGAGHESKGPDESKAI